LSIKFGTDGWRAITGKDFTEANVERVTLAIGKYICDTYGGDKKIIIGYDPRHRAKEFAELCANILINKNFNVELSEKVVPTPILAYNALYKNACAVMFTASHNPPEYLGMKYIPDYAGPATSDITDKIVENLDKECSNGTKGAFKKVDFSVEYYKHIETLIDFKKVQKVKSNIIFDGLYSASIGYFDEILKKHVVPFKSLHMEHDPNFGGKMPDPKPEYLKELIELVKNEPNSIGMANDGDADRFGIINEAGEYVSPNEIISILLKYLVKKGYKGSVVKTVGSSILIDNVAKALDIDVIETAVGFKHVGEAMRNNLVIIGGEESGGLSIQNHIPEKDGLLANLLVLEVMGDTGKSLVELQQEIYELGGKFYNKRIDLKKSDSAEIKTVLDKVKGIVSLGEFEVTDKDFKDGIKLMFGDKAKILIRPSGTEPLLRIYFEADSPEKINYLQQALDKIEKIL